MHANLQKIVFYSIICLGSSLVIVISASQLLLLLVKSTIILGLQFRLDDTQTEWLSNVICLPLSEAAVVLTQLLCGPLYEVT